MFVQAYNSYLNYMKVAVQNYFCTTSERMHHLFIIYFVYNFDGLIK